MSEKIQQKLDQETFSPVFTVFLMILLRISGLFDGFDDAEPELGDFEVDPSADRLAEKLLECARADKATPFREMIENTPIYEPPFRQPIYNNASPEWMHFTIAPFGEFRVQVPEDVVNIEIDLPYYAYRWIFRDGSVGPLEDLMRYRTNQHLNIRVGGGGYDAYCTPSRRPITGRDSHGRLVHEGLNFDANGQPFMAVIDPRGETGEQGEQGVRG